MANDINFRNQREFKKETNLYVVEPLTKTTVSWKELSDVSDNKKATILDLTELKGMNLYAKLVNQGECRYWKLFIVFHKKVDILYVETFALNPINVYIP